jgi:hypothetical protein
MARKGSKNPGRWISPASLGVCAAVFMASVFCFYVSAESNVFYRTDVVTLEFLTASVSGAAVVYLLYRFIFPAGKRESRDLFRKRPKER